MAIVKAADAELSFNTVGTTLTASVNVPAGDDRILIFGVAIQGAATISGVTYAGTAMSNNDQAGTPNAMTVANGTDVRVYIWRLIAPVVGTNNVVVTFSAACRGMWAASVWTGVDQTTALGTRATNTGSSTGTSITPTVDVSSASGEVVVDLFGNVTTNLTGVTRAAGAGQTELGFKQSGATVCGGHSYEDGAATTTMSWTVTVLSSLDHDWATVGVPLKPSVAVSAALDSSVTVQELRISPIRRAPIGLEFAFRDTTSGGGGPETGANAAYQNAARWAASGAYPFVMRARILEFDDQEYMTLDTVWCPPSVAEAGAMALTQLPTPNSPGASLVVTTRDRIVQYPLPLAGDPVTVDGPQLITTGVNFNEIVATKFSEWDEGGGPYILHGVHVRTRDVIKDTDFIGVAYVWDDFNEYSTVQWMSGDDLWFEWGGEQSGHVLKIWVAQYDGANDEAVAPRITRLDWYVSKVEDEAHQTHQPTLSTYTREPQ